MSGLTRGPLAAEVYWRRRLLVIGFALLLVVTLARVLGNGSDGSDPGRAAQTGAETTPSPSATATSAAVEPSAPVPSTKKQVRKAKQAAKKAAKAAADAAAATAAAAAAAVAAAALPDPIGPCGDTDVVITPTVPSPVAGSDVAIDLDLRTRFSPACTWKVSPDSLALKVTSGQETIWSVQDCPAAVPTQDVVLRRAVATNVQVVWSGKRSDDTCSGRTAWASAGFYHVLVAALAGEPTDVQFELTLPSPPVVVKTEKPKTTKSGKARKNKNG